MKTIKAYLFPSIMLITSLAMAGIAAYISVSGLSKLFAGAGATVLLMTGIIEFSKVVITTYLHKSDFSKKNLLLNIPLAIITVIIMLVTSLGVYGFLANGYTITAGHLDKNKGQIEIIESKIKTYENKIEGLESRKENNTNRSNKLTDLRVQQETRIDSLYKKEWYRSARKVEAQVAESNKEIQRLMGKNAEADSLIQIENEKIGELRNQIIDLNNSDINAELGPLMYIASLTGLEMDHVINYIILILIFIFDPAAVLMLVAANHMFDDAKRKLKEKSVDNNKGQMVGEDETFVPYYFPSFSGSTIQSVSVTDPSDAEKESIKESIEGVLLTGTTGYSEISEEKTELEEKAEKFFKEKEKKKEEFLDMIEEKNKEIVETEGKVEVSEEVFEIERGSDESIEIVEEELDPEYKETLYVNLAKALFEDGEIERGQRFHSYDDFVKKCRKRGINSPEKLIRDFVTTCLLLKIIVDDEEGYKVANKSLEQALKLILLVEE